MEDRLVYLLESEDLSHVGGAMGSEYSTPAGTTAHATQESAKAAAESRLGRKITEWRVTNGRTIYADCGGYGFRITAQDVGL